MKALTFTGKESITFETISDPQIIEPSDVIVNVKFCAICGSDLHVYHGRETGIDIHTCMGHEFTGEVIETGSAVKQLKIGDRVISPFTTNCGHCYYCRIGLTSRCEKNQLFGWVENGIGLQGGQAEYVRVPLADSTLHPLPEDITYREALLLGDVLSTGYYCAHQAEIKPHHCYGVIGCGPVGLMAICSAFMQGAEHVYAFDTIPERLEKARQFGATVINAEKNDVVTWVKEHTLGRGLDAVMDAVGNSSAGRLAYDLVRPGGIISVVGVCTDPHFSFSPTDAYNKNITYKVGRCPARYYIETLIPLVREHRFDLASVFTHHFPLRDGVHGYELFANKKDNCLKVLLEP
jgi:2-desacetyl-2-hydroxyethyl bacteriochlorophyllide A dehydrogenase